MVSSKQRAYQLARCRASNTTVNNAKNLQIIRFGTLEQWFERLHRLHTEFFVLKDKTHDLLQLLAALQ